MYVYVYNKLYNMQITMCTLCIFSEEGFTKTWQTFEKWLAQVSMSFDSFINLNMTSRLVFDYMSQEHHFN